MRRGRIKGMTVVLLEPRRIGADAFGADVVEWVETPVENVLVSPVSAEDAATMLALSGRRAVYALGIPKGDTHAWEDARVRFFGRDWRAFGIPTQGQEELMPLAWNQKVMVERYE